MLIVRNNERTIKAAIEVYNAQKAQFSCAFCEPFGTKLELFFGRFETIEPT
jgi:hypothetical protein